MTDMPSDQELTQLLQRWSEGNKDALKKLMPVVYEELHRVAKRYMSRENPAHTLQTTALVNEVYLRLIDWKNAKWQDRAHFFAVSATMMRRILVDHARSRRDAKRAAARRISLDESLIVSDDYTEDLLALNEAVSVVAPGARNRTSKSELAEMLLPVNVAVKELPALTVPAPNVISAAFGGFAGGANIVVTSPAGKFGQGAGPGPEYVMH